MKRAFALLLAISCVAMLSQTAFAQTSSDAIQGSTPSVSQEQTVSDNVIYRFWHRNLNKEGTMRKVEGTFTLNTTYTITFRVFQSPSDSSNNGKSIASHFILHNNNNGSFVPVSVNGTFSTPSITLSPGTYSMYYENKSEFPIDFDAFVLSSS
ncbi:hypothetical protein BBG47_27170 [Paenibacillus sp. KS1]|uniref:hypothetical protein n=1 Tax=Paenibacillus sp. KS1 TaxID=1849249 RepID=UPI000806517C|nr:hypothetical protein [Paenibacillus sp. KS1]OBY76430.1 hypothetical protein BBG47_27170 [Paenibacillus sp. KS1]